MKIRRRNFKKVGEEPNFWPSFTDVMSTVVLVLFFLVLMAYIQNIITAGNRDALELEVEDLQKDYDSTSMKLSEETNKLRIIQDELEDTAVEVEEGVRKLRLSELEIEQQNKIIAASNQELGNLRTKLEKIAVMRVDILKKVKESIESEIGKTNDKGQSIVTIGDNANIIINENLVFDYNSYTLKSDGKKILDQFAKAFENVLDEKSVRDYIDSINIEGYTDDVGDTIYNRELSIKRSTEVVNYLMMSNPMLETRYGDYFAAVGFSEFRRITEGTTDNDRQKNRRIEISIAIKDSNIQNMINEYLSETENIINTDQGDYND